MKNLHSPSGTKEGRKEMFYLTTHSTHFNLRLYGVGHMVKDDSDSERGNPLPPHGLLFPVNSKGYFIRTIPTMYTCFRTYEIIQLSFFISLRSYSWYMR